MSSKEAHPGSWLGDLTNEWKQAKPPEKVFIVGVVIAVVGIALYMHNKNNVSQPGANTNGIPANFQQGTGGGGGGTTGTPGAPGAPGAQGPQGKPGVPGAPGKPPIVRQPTTVTHTYATVSHAPTKSVYNAPVAKVTAPPKPRVPVIPYSAWTPPPSRTPGSSTYVAPSHISAPRPGPSGGTGIWPVPAGNQVYGNIQPYRGNAQ